MATEQCPPSDQDVRDGADQARGRGWDPEYWRLKFVRKLKDKGIEWPGPWDAITSIRSPFSFSRASSVPACFAERPPPAAGFTMAKNFSLTVIPWGISIILHCSRLNRQDRFFALAMGKALGQGDAVVFAVRDRPVRGTRGAYRVRMRHGVSRLRSGRRGIRGPG